MRLFDHTIKGVNAMIYQLHFEDLEYPKIFIDPTVEILNINLKNAFA